jgi:hypothetical protein
MKVIHAETRETAEARTHSKTLKPDTPAKVLLVQEVLILIFKDSPC